MVIAYIIVLEIRVYFLKYMQYKVFERRTPGWFKDCR